MATQSYEELIASATKIKNNELPESNTHDVVGDHLVQMATKAQEEYNQRVTGICEYNVSKQFPTGGIEGSNKYTLELALQKVPTELRQTVGLKCSFWGESGELESWEYQGGTFTATGNWLAVGGKKFTELEQKNSLIWSKREKESDIIKANNANNVIKALYVQGETNDKRVVLSYLNKAGANFQLGLTLYDDETGSSETFADITGLSYKFDEVVSIYNNSSDKNVVALAYLSSADWVSSIANQGEGYNRLPYCGDLCFEYTKQPIINNYYLDLNIKDLEQEIAAVDGKVTFTPASVQRTDNNDYIKRDYFNNCVKSLYFNEKPADNERYVVSYFIKYGDGSKFQLGVTKYNIVTQDTSSVSVAENTYDFDKVVPIYKTSSKEEVVGYIFAEKDKYEGAVSNQGEGYARLPYINEACFSYENQSLINNYFIEEKIIKLSEEISNAEKSNKTILAWGDSITWGSASSTNNNCYTAILRNLIEEKGLSYKVINCGVGGESFQNILVRQGALGFYLADDITLPANPSDKVEIQRTTNYINNKKFRNTWYGEESYFSLLLQGETGRDNTGDEFKTVNPIYVNGIKCIMTIEGNAENNVIYLSSANQLENDFIIKSGECLYPHGNTFKGDISVFSIGTNGGFQVKTEETIDIDSSITQYIELTDLAIEKSNSGKYIVCSPYGGTALRDMGVEGLKKLEAALTKRYGNRHFNWRKYLIEYGLSDAGLSPTTEDTEAIEKGEVPPSLLSDGLHPNDYGHRIIGEKIYKMIIDLGYLN